MVHLWKRALGDYWYGDRSIWGRIEQSLMLLSAPGFEGPQEEFLKAQAHYGEGKQNEAINEALKAFDEEPERWIDVTWDIDEDNAQRFPAKIAVTALNEPGSLAQVAAVIGEADGNIDNIKITKQVPDYAEMVIDLEVWDLTHLNEILAGLRAKDVVSSAVRVSG